MSGSYGVHWPPPNWPSNGGQFVLTNCHIENNRSPLVFEAVEPPAVEPPAVEPPKLMRVCQNCGFTREAYSDQTNLAPKRCGICA